MSDERDHYLQDWFSRSSEALPSQPFTQTVVEQIRRKERHLQWQRYAAFLAVFSSVCLLLPELIAPLNMLATLPLAVVEVGGEQWPTLVVLGLGSAWWLVKQTRATFTSNR